MTEASLLEEQPPVDLGPAPAAVVQPLSAAALHAMHGAHMAGLISPVVIGDRRKIADRAAQEGISVDHWSFEEVAGDDAAADRAASLAAAGQVGMVVKGNVKTEVLMRAVLANRNLQQDTGRLSHVFAIYLPAAVYHKALFVSDGAINVAPSLAVKVQIACNAVDLLQALGIRRPRAAILSASEVVNMSMPSSVEAAEIANRIGARAEALGPVALDVALSRQAASVKGVESPVAGDADLLVCPNIESGNAVVKMAARQPGTVIAGLVVGGGYPIVLPSRGDSRESQLASYGLGRKYLAWLQHTVRRT
ncbi:hypothetical protein B1R94_11990 [Mycolicibacterium litorale]|nr:hypothetical protein B1R94_11990 [Mycolicibacterium litorale]